MATDREKWLAAPISPNAHGWCGDCPWTVEGEWSHKHADHHSALLGHVSHCDDGEARLCSEPFVSGLLGFKECARPLQHTEGYHRAADGFEWPVENPVHSVENS